MGKFRWSTLAFMAGIVYSIIGEFGTQVMTSMGQWAMIFKPVEWTHKLLLQFMATYANLVPIANIALWGLIGLIILNIAKR